jgi:hypothetical protein
MQIQLKPIALAVAAQYGKLRTLPKAGYVYAQVGLLSSLHARPQHSRG